LLLTTATQIAEILVRYVGVYVIIVHVFQIDTTLFKQNQQICVVAYKISAFSHTFDRNRSNRHPRVDSLQNTLLYFFFFVKASYGSWSPM